MGVVYLGIGWDGSQVAVKVLRPELADDPDFRRRFRREVSALMRVTGLCTVRVIEADTESPRPFMVTEYAEGPSLAEYIDSHGLIGPGMLYGLATGLAEALTVIHAAGIVHRDLKPSNVILTQAGPKVIDFGIAQALDATPMTRTGMMVGSAGFMAPEQISGRPGPAADIFVWGVTVAYAATGQPPFGTGDTHAVLYRVMHGDPEIAGVPGPLRPFVAAALTKDPGQRPTARQLLDRRTGLPAGSAPRRGHDSPTQTILSTTWPPTGPDPARSRPAGEAVRPGGSLLLDPARPAAAPAGSGAARGRSGRISRRTAAIGTSALAAAAVAAAVVFAVLPGHAPSEGPSANEAGPGAANPVAPNALPAYPGQLTRGVFQQIERIAASGNTMVTTGSQTTGDAVRQQFFVSTDAGRTWRLAPVQLPGGGQPPLGYTATRIAGGPRGWLASGPDSFTALAAGPGGFTTAVQFTPADGAPAAAIWTSANGASWTRAAVSGLTEGGGHDLSALALSGSAVTGIDSVQTQAGQQFAVRRLPAG